MSHSLQRADNREKNVLRIVEPTFPARMFNKRPVRADRVFVDLLPMHFTFSVFLNAFRVCENCCNVSQNGSRKRFEGRHRVIGSPSSSPNCLSWTEPEPRCVISASGPGNFEPDIILTLFQVLHESGFIVVGTMNVLDLTLKITSSSDPWF